MLRHLKKIKFECIVIIGGAIECIILAIYLIKNICFLVEVGDTIQLLIITFIIRRLFRIVQRQKLHTHVPLYQ